MSTSGMNEAADDTSAQCTAAEEPIAAKRSSFLPCIELPMETVPFVRGDVILSTASLFLMAMSEPQYLLDHARDWHDEDMKRQLQQVREAETEDVERLEVDVERQRNQWERLSEWEQTAFYIGSLVDFVKYQDDMKIRRDREKAKDDADESKKQEFRYRGAFLDERFPLWDINPFEGGCMAASSGPQDDPNAASGPPTDEYYASYYPGTFLYELICARKHVTISTVYAMGHCTRHVEGEGVNTDFSNYFLHGSEEEVFEYPAFFEGLADVSYRTRSRRTISPYHRTFELEVKLEPLARLRFWKRVTKTIIVDNVSIRDGAVYPVTPFDLKKLYDDITRCTKRNEYLLVHCASGRGRSGLLTLAASIFFNVDSIFPEDELPWQHPPLGMVCKRIYRILEQLRDTRPGLVESSRQFVNAIQIGLLLIVTSRVEKLYSQLLWNIDRLQEEVVSKRLQGSSRVSKRAVKATQQSGEPQTIPISLANSLHALRFLAVGHFHSSSLFLIGQLLLENDSAITMLSHAGVDATTLPSGEEWKRFQVKQAEPWLMLAYVFGNAEEGKVASICLRKLYRVGVAPSELVLPNFRDVSAELLSTDPSGGKSWSLTKGMTLREADKCSLYGPQEVIDCMLRRLTRDGKAQFFLRMSEVFTLRYKECMADSTKDTVVACIETAYYLGSLQPRRNQFQLDLLSLLSELSQKPNDLALAARASIDKLKSS